MSMPSVCNHSRSSYPHIIAKILPVCTCNRCPIRWHCSQCCWFLSQVPNTRMAHVACTCSSQNFGNPIDRPRRCISGSMESDCESGCESQCRLKGNAQESKERIVGIERHVNATSEIDQVMRSNGLSSLNGLMGLTYEHLNYRWMKQKDESKQKEKKNK